MICIYEIHTLTPIVFSPSEMLFSWHQILREILCGIFYMSEVLTQHQKYFS